MSPGTGFVYFFSEMPGNVTTDEGVFHGAEIRFVFHILASLQYGPGQCEVNLSSQMVCFWANFAATGDPNQGDDCNAPSVIGRHGKGVNWRPFQPEAPPKPQTNRI